jgi:hypothetical protein
MLSPKRHEIILRWFQITLEVTKGHLESTWNIFDNFFKVLRKFEYKAQSFIKICRANQKIVLEVTKGHLESTWNILDNFFDFFRSCLLISGSFKKIECQVFELIFRLNPGGHPTDIPKTFTS